MYSGIDWFFDVFFVSEAFKRGYGDHASVGAIIMFVNMVVNLLAMIYLISHEKKRNNVNHQEWKQSGPFVGLVEFFALNNIGLIKYLPWRDTPFQGYASRRSFAICSLLPLLIENVPQVSKWKIETRRCC